MAGISQLKIQVQEISETAVEKFSQASSVSELYQVRVLYLGKNGQITALMKKLQSISPEEKPVFGQIINQLKNEVENQYQKFQKILKQKQEDSLSEKDLLDITLPGPSNTRGAFHPLEKIIQKTTEIFSRLGYARVSGPLIETDWYNFSALNIPPDHPSRDNHDTFYLDSKHLLRTHTSPVQIRSLERLKPPLAVVAPGPVFRRDHPDSSHSPHFYQIEGLFIDRHVSMSHLKGVLSYFLKNLQEADSKVRFRPSFFPFTEPSAEYDSSCFLCHGEGCSFCKKSGWIEIGGCGLVHPQVLRASEVDPEKWQGFAFGMGVDRLALLQYGIPDIRLFYENRVSFLKQFT